jgi:hypothetical protein
LRLFFLLMMQWDIKPWSVCWIVVLPLENWQWASNFGSVIRIGRYLNLGAEAIGYWELGKTACTLMYISNLQRKYKCIPFLWYHRCSFLSPPLISLLDSSSVFACRIRPCMWWTYGFLVA